MITDDQIRDEKLQYDINREAAKFTYSPLGKAFVKQIKTVEGQGKKQTEALKDLKPKGQTKEIEGKSDNKNNQSITTNIFNDLITHRAAE